MKSLITLLLLATAISTPALAEVSQQEMLKRLYEMRQRLERDRQQEENEARANIGSIRSATAADVPTVSQMRRDMGQALSQIANNYRCLDLDVENNGGNTVVVCGNNNGSIHGENTTAGGNLIGAVNTVVGSGAGPAGAGAAGAGGTVLLGPMGNPVNNSGLYVETNSNTSTNTSLVEGDVNGLLQQSNTQANGDIGDRTVLVNN